MALENLLSILLIVSCNIFDQKVVHGQMSSGNASKIFHKLMNGYDNRIIPNEDGKPLEVHINLVIQDFVPRSESTSVSFTPYLFETFFRMTLSTM